MRSSLLPRRRSRSLLLAASFALALAACGTDDGAPPEDVADPDADVDEVPAGTDEEPDEGAAEVEAAGGEQLTIVATTSILGDVVEQLVAGDGEVTVLMPPGVDPHAYQPSAAEAALLREADLVVANGLLLEENLVTALEAAEEDGVRVVRVAEHLDPLEAGDGPGHAHEEDDHGHAHDDGDDHALDDDHGHAHGPEDPHVWFDPIRMADGVLLIGDELAAVGTAVDEAEWRARAEAYRDELLDVHAQMEALFDAIPAQRRLLVTNHDALGYLAHRYDLDVVGTVIPGSSTQAETDARAFAELVETIERTGVPAIFAENTDSTVLAEQLASEVLGRDDLDVEVVRIHTDALGEEGSGAETYLGLLQTTAQRIAGALS